jgi:hypothetical protein
VDIISKVDDTETLTLTDVDLVFGPGNVNALTLNPGDEITYPEPRLADGDICVTYANGERIRINGTCVQWVSIRTRIVTRKKKPAAQDRAA